MKQYYMVLLKNKFIIGLGLSLLLLSCKNPTSTTPTVATPTTEPIAKEKVLYSNLGDILSQAQVKRALMTAGIAPDIADRFLEDVDFFNSSVGNKGLVREGFIPFEDRSTDYNVETIQTLWETKHPEFVGYNCRLTAFGLMKDIFVVDCPVKGNTEYLFLDSLSIAQSPKKMLPRDEEKFFNLFAAVPTDATKDVQVHLNKLQQQWRDRGIDFMRAEAKLISVVFHSQISPKENELFIGHVGVLVPYERKLLFIEKLAFQQPYQALIFKDRKALSDYLMNTYDVDFNQPTARPFILENDQLMEVEPLEPAL